ncbi:MAG: hypothetical protein ACFFCH_09840 [Promethearchaeota archaeon]
MSSNTRRYLELRHREMWVQLFTEGLDKYSTPKTKADVLNGRDEISPSSTTSKVCDWICAAIKRLDLLVTDKETRQNIMLCCSNRFPVDLMKPLREEFDQTGDLDALLALMDEDRSWHGFSRYGCIERNANILYVTKIPADPEGFKSTTDKTEKQVRYCHCPHIRPAIRKQKRISPTFCLCGSGCYKTLWEGLLNQSVHVEVLETVAQGATYCRFAIHLPDQFKTDANKGQNERLELPYWQTA